MAEEGEVLEVESTVPPSADGRTVVEYLAGRFTYRSRTAWAAAVAAGEVSRNGVVCDAGTVVQAGDRVACRIWLVDPPANYDYSILHEDRWMLGIGKPAGLLMHGFGPYARANLVYHLRHRHRPPYPEARLVNRLDAETSGVVVIARDRKTLAALQRQWNAGAVEKEYVALVHGVPQPATGLIDFPLGKTGERHRPVAVDLESGKPAQTRYDTIATDGDRRALLSLVPLTGRTHQIRVHLAAVGHPVIGDRRYGRPEDDLPRHWLHCRRTTLRHPHTGQPLVLEAPLPDDWPEM